MPTDQIACRIDTTADLALPLGAPVVPPLEWFEELPDGFHPSEMAYVDLCGDVGRFATLVAEDGIPFTFPFNTPGGVFDAPEFAGERLSSEAYYFNDRNENLLTVADRSGELVQIPAGAIGFGHSPDDIASFDQLYEWHDRDLSSTWTGAALERALIRARIVEVEDRYLVAVGAVVPTVTVGEALSIYHAETSGEMGVVATATGAEVLQIHGLSLVLAGNTRTSASTTQRVRRAKLIHATKETPTMQQQPAKAACGCEQQTADDVETVDVDRATIDPETAAMIADQAQRIETLEQRIESLQLDVATLIGHLMEMEDADDPAD